MKPVILVSLLELIFLFLKKEMQNTNELTHNQSQWITFVVDNDYQINVNYAHRLRRKSSKKAVHYEMF